MTLRSAAMYSGKASRAPRAPSKSDRVHVAAEQHRQIEIRLGARQAGERRAEQDHQQRLRSIQSRSLTRISWVVTAGCHLLLVPRHRGPSGLG